MKKQKTKQESKMKYVCKRGIQDCGGGSGVYCLGVIGAAIYYNVTTVGFWVGVWGVIKAFVWPAFLVYELFKFLGV
jgi:hypothetical protein